LGYLKHDGGWGGPDTENLGMRKTSRKSKKEAAKHLKEAEIILHQKRKNRYKRAKAIRGKITDKEKRKQKKRKKHRKQQQHVKGEHWEDSPKQK